jgi:ligand-binding sensor domain-containing protein/two-component sensor histidine kinase
MKIGSYASSFIAGSRLAGLVLISILLSTPLSAQQYNFKNYTNEQLPSVNIYSSFQDSKGFMWFATDGGVARFDGYSFTTYTKNDGLGDNEVFDFMEDTRGRLWFQTANGKVSYYKEGVIWNSDTDSTLKAMDSNTAMSCILEDRRGNIWITNLDGIICVKKNGKVRRFSGREINLVYRRFFGPEMDLVHKLFELGQNTFLVADIHGLFKLTFDDSLQNVTDVKRFSYEPTTFHRFMKFQRLNEDEIVFKDDRVLFYGNLATDTFTKMNTFPFGTRILNVSVEDHDIWVGTTDGVVKYDLKTKKQTQAVLSDHAVTSCLRDREGNYWFTTYGHGVFFCTSMNVHCYTKKDGLRTDWVNCLVRDSSNVLWIGYGIGSNGAISYLKKSKLHDILLTNEAAFGGLETLSISFTPRDEVLVSTTMGAYLYRDNIKGVYYEYTRCAVEYPPGNVWMANSGRVYTIPRHAFNKFLIKPDWKTFQQMDSAYLHGRHANIEVKAPTVRPRKIFLTHDRELWIGTDQKLFKAEGDTLTPVGDRSLFTGGINDLLELKDRTLAVATSVDGVVMIKDKLHVKSITMENGLSSNICNAVDIDRDGTIWIGTSNGLNKVSGYPDSIRIEYFNIYDGLLANDITDLQVMNDTVWVASKSGISFFHKDISTRKSAAPLVYIQRMTIGGEPVSLDTRSPMVFKHNQNDVGILYTGLLYSNGDPLLYRYKLHSDDPWRYTRSTSVYLPQLNPDEYEFTVAAQGRFGQWSEEATIRFEINKPVWQSAIFIVSMILITLGLIGWITQAYINLQRKEFQRQHRVTLSELKSLRAQMNPHFLFNALNSIQGVLLKNNIETTQDYLGRFSKLMRLILDHSDKTAVTIREELESITNYLEIEQLRAGHEFQYKIEIEPELDIEKAEIPAMILQPFIENAIWHGFGHRKDGSELLVIRFGSIEDDLLVTITDNGIGRKKATALRKRNHKSKGIQLVRERIDILNSYADHKIELKIDDLEDEQGNHPGTRVSIRIPTATKNLI